MKTHHILILEDDLKTLSILLKYIYFLEEELIPRKQDIALTVLSTYKEVEDYINPNPDIFDVILLDRDCKMGGSFHALDLNKFSPGKIISISSTPEYNQAAREKGIKRVVHKDFKDLETFAAEVIRNIKELL